MQIDNWNQTAVKVLLADAQSALALTQAEEIRELLRWKWWLRPVPTTLTLSDAATS